MKTALEVIKEFTPRPDFDYSGTWVVDAMEAYKNQSQPIEKEQEWIDVSERLPENGTAVVGYDTDSLTPEKNLVYYDDKFLYIAHQQALNYTDCISRWKYRKPKSESSPTEQPEAQTKYQFRKKWMGEWTEWMDCHVSVYQEAIVQKDKTFEARKVEQQNQPQPEKAQEEQSELWNDVDSGYIRWPDQEMKLPELLRDFTITRKHHD